MVAAIERAGRDAVAAGAAPWAAEAPTRRALERAGGAEALRAAPGLPAVLRDAAWQVGSGAEGAAVQPAVVRGAPDAELILAQDAGTLQGARHPSGLGRIEAPRLPRITPLTLLMSSEFREAWSLMVTGSTGDPAKELVRDAQREGMPPAEAEHLLRAADLAQANPDMGWDIYERALDNLAYGRVGEAGEVDLMTGVPAGPQVLPGPRIEEQGPVIHEGPIIPADQGPQIWADPAPEDPGLHVMPGPIIEEQGPIIHEGPIIPEQDPSDFVTMAVPAGPPPEGFAGDWEALEPHERETIHYLLSDQNPVGNRAVVAIPPSHVDPTRPSYLPPLRPGEEDRRPDILLDGVPTELKAVGGVEVQNLDAEDRARAISGAASSRIMDGRGQAGDVIVDLRGQEGATAEIAERAMRRAYGADRQQGGLDSIRLIGPGFDDAYPRRSR